MTVQTSLGSYRVERALPSEVLADLDPSDRVIVDSNVLASWRHLFDAVSPLYVVEPGEASKCLEVFGDICSWLAKTGTTRSGRVFAVGGGVVGDLAGYVAASYMRGVQLIMVPTTLLSMVDSSVGGKVGVDLPEGKNLVGAFWPPAEVRVAVEFLQTLPDRELQCGAAEVWKYGWIMDLDLLRALESRPLGRDDRLEGIVETCIRLKASVVEQDEEEKTGLRATLNFGHTIGHAIEAVMSYEGWTHGEAISVGMVVEARLGEILGLTPPGTAGRVRQGHERQGLPVEVPAQLSAEGLLTFIRRDKKTGADGLAFSLLTSAGECKLVQGVSEDTVRRALTA